MDRQQYDECYRCGQRDPERGHLCKSCDDEQRERWGAV